MVYTTNLHSQKQTNTDITTADKTSQNVFINAGLFDHTICGFCNYDNLHVQHNVIHNV